MNTKQLPLLSAILAIVVGIIVVANIISNKQPAEKTLAVFPQLATEECGRIIVTALADTVSLVKKGKDWFVIPGKYAEGKTTSPLLARETTGKARKISEYPADSAFIQMALDKLKALKKEDIISQNPNKQFELEVDSIRGTGVEVFNDKGISLGMFYLGKNGADWSSNFFRMRGSKDVYLVGGSIKYSFFTDKSRWRDKTITKFDRTFAKSIEIVKRDSAAIQLALTAPSPKDTAAKPKWQIVSPVKDSAKSAEVDKILNTLMKFSASDFEEDTAISTDSMGFTKPFLTVTVSLENGEKKTVVVGNEKGSEGKRWIRTPDKDVTFLIYKYNVESLDRSVNALRGIEEKKPAPAPAKPPAKGAAKAEAKKKTAAAKK
jgi:hypothetical protein